MNMIQIQSVLRCPAVFSHNPKGAKKPDTFPGFRQCWSHHREANTHTIKHVYITLSCNCG